MILQSIDEQARSDNRKSLSDVPRRWTIGASASARRIPFSFRHPIDLEDQK
jgi:hypothetical protein